MPGEQTTISASRVPAVLGFDKRCSRLTLYLRTLGRLQEQDLSGNEAVLEGRFYERATADIACHKFGMKVVEGFEQKELVAGNLSGHPDFLVVDEHDKLAILEVKNPFWAYKGGESDDDWGEPGTDQVPKAYLIQSMIYCELFRAWVTMNCCGSPSQGIADLLGVEDANLQAEAVVQADVIADYAYVVARLRGGVERFKVPYDEDIVRKVRSEVDMFLERVRMEDPPDPETEEDHRNAWVVSNEKVAECNMAMVSMLNSIRTTNEQIRKLQKAVSEMKVSVLGQMQEAGVLEYVDHETGDRVRVATAQSSRTFDKQACWDANSQLLIEKGYVTVDTTRLRAEQKALYDQFMKKPEGIEEQTRTIRIKNKALDALLQKVGATSDD